jgi:hypothetical protein
LEAADPAAAAPRRADCACQRNYADRNRHAARLGAAIGTANGGSFRGPRRDQSR